MIEAALDTSWGTSFALARDGELAAREHRPFEGRNTQEAMVPWLQDLLHAHDLAPGRIVRWTVGLGPGSFSGIRVGIAFAKGVCLQSGAELRGCPSSFALARQAAADLDAGEQIAVLYDARRAQAIVTLYEKTDTGLIQTSPAHIPDTKALHEECAGCRWLVTGQGERVRAALSDRDASRLVQLDELEADHLLAAPAELMQTEKHGNGGTALQPVYVRPPATRGSKSRA